MARPKSYRELIAWQKAKALARQVYLITAELPKREAYGLVNQIRRAAVSVVSNIAEGYGRLTDLQFRHSLGNARGSLYEMQTQLELAMELAYWDQENTHQLMEQSWEVARLINGLLTSLSHSTSSVAAASNSANPASPANSAKSHAS